TNFGSNSRDQGKRNRFRNERQSHRRRRQQILPHVGEPLLFHAGDIEKLKDFRLRRRRHETLFHSAWQSMMEREKSLRSNVRRDTIEQRSRTATQSTQAANRSYVRPNAEE